MEIVGKPVRLSNYTLHLLLFFSGYHFHLPARQNLPPNDAKLKKLLAMEWRSATILVSLKTGVMKNKA